MWWVLSLGNRRALTCAGLWSHVIRRLALLAKHLLFIFNDIIKDLEKFFPLYFIDFFPLSLDFLRFLILSREEEDLCALFTISLCGLYSKVGLISSHFLVDKRIATGGKKPQIRPAQEMLVVRFDLTVLYTLLWLLADQSQGFVFAGRIEPIREQDVEVDDSS